MKKKTNKFTHLPDMKPFLNASLKLKWLLNIYDNKDKLVDSIQSSEANIFEGSCSIVWYEKLNKLNKSVHKIRIFTSIPVYLNLNNGKLSNMTGDKQNEYLDINQSKNCLVYETNFNRKALKPINHANSLIKMFELNKDVILACWSASTDDLAFITFNKVFSFEFVSLISEQTMTNDNKKSYVNDLELDRLFGLHDYQVYFCIRNQTSTIFLSLSQHVYSAEIVNRKEAKYISLTVVDSETGYPLSMLPKFTWNTESLKKNVIDMISITDLALFDSNNRLIVSDS